MLGVLKAFVSDRKYEKAFIEIPVFLIKEILYLILDTINYARALIVKGIMFKNLV